MTLEDYQQRAMTTCLPTSANFGYMMLNLVGEVGEFSSKVGKAIRKGKLRFFDDNDIDCTSNITEEEWGELNDALKKEAGDILWQLSGLCSVMNWSLEDIAQMNLDKLQARKENKTIDGEGDGITKEERTHGIA